MHAIDHHLAKIESDRLSFRLYEPSDFEAVHSYASLPDFSQYDVWGPNTEQETHDFIARSINHWHQEHITWYVYAVVEKESGRVIGGCGLYREGQASAVGYIGYSIHPDFQCKGYATELSRRLIQLGFEDLGLMVVYATCDTRNTASYKVMEKAGMRRVATIPRHKEIKGHWRDSFRYEIVRGERA